MQGPGKRVGPYVVEAPLGRGGGGAVYRAWDPRLRRSVALKVAEGGTPVTRARLWREARTLAQIEHDNLVQVFDVGEDAARRQVYVAMELLGGARLQDLLGEPWPEPLALRVGLDLCAALDALHAADITHRDVKPSNIVFDDEGRLRLVDMGLAKSLDPEDAITETGDVVGTVGYMSPEQLEGRECGPASDVFSTCVVLYCLLAGRHPFQRESASGTALANAMVSYPALCSVREEASPEIEAALADGLAVHAEDRPPDGAALAEALEEIGTAAAHEAVAGWVRGHAPAPPAPAAPRRLGRWLALAGLLALAAPLGWWWARPAPISLPPQARVEVPTPDSAAAARLGYIVDRSPHLRAAPLVPGRAGFALALRGDELVLRGPGGHALDVAEVGPEGGLARALSRWLPGLPSGAPRASDAVWSAYGEGLIARREGRYAVAAARFSAALALAPGFGPAFAEWAELTESKIGPSPEGLSPREAARVKAARQFAAGQGEAALATLYAAKGRWPDDLPIARRIMDLRFWGTSWDFDAVLEAAKDVLRIDPLQGQAASRVLRVLAWRGRIEAAQQELERYGALAHAGDTLRGELALYSGDYAAARGHFEAALQAGPDDYAAHMLVVAELLGGRAGAATALARRLVQDARLRGGRDDWAWHLGIEARVADGRYAAADEAVRAWEQVSASGRRQGPRIRFEVARLRDGDAAVRDAARARWRTQTSTAARVESLIALARVETDPAALAAYDRWLETAPGVELGEGLLTARAILRGRLQLARGEVEAGLEALRGAVLPLARVQREADLGRRVDAQMVFAMALDAAGRRAEAAEVWRQVREAGYARLWVSYAWRRADARLSESAATWVEP